MFDLPQLMVLIPALPLAAAVLTGLLGPRLLRRQSHWPAVLAVGASLLLSLMLLSEVHRQAQAGSVGPGFERTYLLWTWADVPAPPPPGDATEAGSAAGTPAGAADFRVEVALRADPLSAIMLATVTLVGLLVVIYSAGYMHGEPGYWRYFSYLNLFIFSMTMLVSASNFLLLYVFWEAVGLCSYLLIGFWYQHPPAAEAGKKAFLVNRVGDFGFAVAVLLIWLAYGTLNFHDTFHADGTLAVMGVLGQERLTVNQFLGGGLGLAIALLLFVGACGKSAQFPLHVWLPDAMEGPTPVSALIHAATMVTAGVYLVARCTPLFLSGAVELPGATVTASQVVAGIGGFTALLAGLIALTQTDLKRVLAYSTVSQLGLMFLALGTATLAGAVAGMFHLFTHAFFKALLFLGAGSVMHAMGNVIDMRHFGGLRRILPVTHATFLFGCLALAGVVPFAGFWSKDAILAAVEHEAAASAYYQVLYWAALATSALTAFYTFRAFFLTFYGPLRLPEEAGHHAHEAPPSMTLPLAALAAASLVVGAYFEHTHGFAEFLRRTPTLIWIPDSHRGPLGEFHIELAAVSTLIAVLGIAAAALFYLGRALDPHKVPRLLRPWYQLSYRKFYLDEIYNALLVLPGRALAIVCYAVDRWLVDGLVDLVGWLPRAVGAAARSLQCGLVPFYALAMLVGLLILIGSLLL